MTPTDEERLLLVIQASDTVLCEDGASEDPVAFRRVGEALARKASALRKLGRLEEAVDVWNELVRRYTSDPSARASLVAMNALVWKARDLEQLGRHREVLEAVDGLVELSLGQAESDRVQLLVARALTVKVRTLAVLGSVERAVSGAEEIVAGIGSADEPELRQWAAWALAFESRMLIADGQIDKALGASVRLEARLLDEPSDPIVRVVEIVNNHSMLLLQLVATNPTAMARCVLLVLINTAGQAVGVGLSRVSQYLPDRVSRRTRLQRVISIGGPGIVAPVLDSRRRALQARASSQAVIAKVGASEDPDLRRCAVAAEFIGGMALVVLGQSVAGFRALNAFADRGDLDAIQAFQWLTKSQKETEGLVGEFGEFSTAAFRARMLGGGDPAITKIAYEDSIADRKASSARPVLSRLLARWLRP